MEGIRPRASQRLIKRIEKEQVKSRGEEMFPKLVEHKGDVPVIKDQLPTIFHAEGHTPGEVQKVVLDTLAGYRASLPLPTSPCWTATSSAMPPSRSSASAASGPPAGSFSSWPARAIRSSSRSKRPAPRCWSRTPAPACSPTRASASSTATGSCSPPATSSSGGRQGAQRHFFFRQLRDTKISAMWRASAAEMNIYAGWCGRALALSHARSGCSVTLSGYMGKGDAFDQALAAFSVAYADQNEKDHAALERAVRKGRVKAVFEEVR